MRTLVHRLASMRIAVCLLVVIVVAMAAGTIVDSTAGPETAGRLVYHALWFELLAVAFAINVACSLVDRWPWGWPRAGFALTHGSLLIILAGALVSSVSKIEGRLALWEGEQSGAFESESGATLTLPFSVRLDSFEIDYHQGTRIPAMFRSRVTVTDPSAALTFPAVIEMNKELSYAGYRLFQSSYQIEDGRDRTVLAVSRDPGQPIVFTGYGVLMAGMIAVLITRLAQRRAALAPQTRPLRIGVRRVAALLIGVGLAAAAAIDATPAAALPGPRDVATLRALAVQHDGRVMPLDTLARETVWQVTGSRYEWSGLDPVALVVGWTLDPHGWGAEPLVAVDGADLAERIGLPRGTTRASFLQLATSTTLLALFEQARSETDAGRPLSGALREAQKVEQRLITMQSFLLKRGIPALPAPGDPAAAWSAPSPCDDVSDLLRLVGAGIVPPSTTARIDREVLYNAVRPTRLAWWILVPAAAVSALAWSRSRRWLDAIALAGLVAGFLAMTWGLATRWMVAGRIPASNMYESMLFLGWGIGLFAVVALVLLRNRLVVFNAAAMSALTMLLVDRLPIDPFIHPMPPVLSGTPWLAIHVPIIMVSYSVLALGVLIAHMQIGAGLLGRRDVVARMSDLLYWYTHIGSILLIAGILTGSIWAASSWGRYWGWDPKEVWSLIAFLAYLAILHGRLDQMIGPLGVAALSIIAFWTILMTYVGVNFVLTTGLHSYGFGGSSVALWMTVVAGAEALFLTGALAAHRGGSTAAAHRASGKLPAL